MKGNALYYTIYLAADDSIVAFGSAGDCAKMMDMTLPSFYSMISCINHGKTKRYEYYSEPLENPEYDLDPYVRQQAAEDRLLAAQRKERSSSHERSRTH